MSTDVNCDRPFSSKVEALAGYGLLPADIAQVLAIGEDALKAEYADELAGGLI